MERGYRSEADALEEIRQAVEAVDAGAEVFLLRRDAERGSLMRVAVYAVRCAAEGNEALVNALAKMGATTNGSAWFAGSEINLESGRLETDYLFVHATIRPKL